jgi:hypothetical protein
MNKIFQFFKNKMNNLKDTLIRHQIDIKIK